MKLDGESLSIAQVWRIAHDREVNLQLADEAKEKMEHSRKFIKDKLDAGEVMYGVNTGFGAFSSVKISDDKIVELQKNLIRSHCCGIGEPFSMEETRAIMALRANALSRGHSGIRSEVVQTILNFLNNDIIPVIPQKGSVGASGDLAPLAHLALALMGEGQVWNGSDHVPASKLINENNISPIELIEKEGLALINGCQVMTAVGLLNLHRARNLAWFSDLAGAISLEALKGSRSAFDPLISRERAHPGEAKTARNLLKILGNNSEIGNSHTDCNKVQDAYSLRCMPAVHGAAKDTLRRTLETLEIEANSSTDNPLVFARENKVLSCGNFHGEPVAFALDFCGIAMSAMASISECRIAKLINPAMSDLPAFLIEDGGINSGMMIVQVAAASLVSENKILSHPASVDSIPTSADKEDHVSMGTIAARKMGQIVGNAENIVAMEILCGLQAIDLLKPLKPQGLIADIYDHVRTKVPYAKKDRVFSEDIQAIVTMIRDESLVKIIENKTGELEW